jgi:diguanylate cyclase (GGDEF)-like protein/PAS domain S-box-containing protein
MADFVALVMEAGERVRAEAEAARYRADLEAESALRSVFEAAPVPLVMARPDGVIELLNPRARDVIGVPADVAPGSVHASRFYAREEDRQALLAEVRANGIVDGREIMMRTWNGEERWCLVSVRVAAFGGAGHVIMGFTQISAQKELEARLRDAATHDALTQLHNRRHFFEAAGRELERARRYGRPLALALIDADRFKEKNDRYGHVVGDELLVALAGVVAGGVRQSDVVARYGGEEIVVLFPETDLEAASAVTERIRRTLAESPIPTSAGPVVMTCSAGVVVWKGEETVERLVDRADRALYGAKSAGRNRVSRG